MADGKWVKNLRPEMSVAAAARQILEARYEVIRTALPLAMREADRDVEHVHQLRVGTRRAGAALRIFATLFPEKPHRKARQQLKKLRRAAGAARDWDVLMLDLRERASQVDPKELPGLDFLLGFAAGWRAEAQKELIEAGEDHGQRVQKTIETLLEHLREDRSEAARKPYVELGNATLKELLKELEWAARGDLDDYSHLHQVRILGKQLRYAMELFADCYPDHFRSQIYLAVEEMQEMLGHANDSHVASLRLGAIRDRYRRMWPQDWKRFQPAIESLLRFHNRRLPRERQRFLKWWEHWQANESKILDCLFSTTRVEQAPAPAAGQTSVKE